MRRVVIAVAACGALAAPSFASSQAIKTLLLGGSAPVWQWNPAATNALPADGSVTVSSPSLGGLVTDASGNLTYAGNNMLKYSNTLSNATWSGSSFATANTNDVVDPDGGYSANKVVFTGANQGIYQASDTNVSWGNVIIAACLKGTAGETISFEIGSGRLRKAVTFTGGWDCVETHGAVTGGANAQLSINTYNSVTARTFYVYKPSLSRITYETAPRTQDQVVTTSAAYYGPKFDYGSGLRPWEQRINYFRSSATGATQNVTVTANQYTLSCFGTGTITLSGTSTAGPLTCAGTVTGTIPSSSLTFTPTAGTLTLTVSGTVTYVNLEKASTPGPRILTGASADVTASADALTANAPLSTYLAAGPWAYSWKNGATGATSCVTGAAGAFSWPQNGWIGVLKVYKAGTQTSALRC